jgi:splicing factor U2AF subunit
MAEYDERYQGNGDTATAEGGYAQAEYPAVAAAGGSPPAGVSDHADGRSSQAQVRTRAPLI